ncbi:hypothetical protein BC938DRAFT_481508 [Jimgerdemannia flammicorona]|uniref:Uncharacterized protein n=1 Tax=Jimgerdemannia flammicorona TaxID=994334 RepID=A0A433QFZ3_9FUNG|nr:hypothetical protein BC938DRAFT_481508 [Jimgerdemannia flammicorona]
MDEKTVSVIYKYEIPVHHKCPRCSAWLRHEGQYCRHVKCPRPNCGHDFCINCGKADCLKTSSYKDPCPNVSTTVNTTDSRYVLRSIETIGIYVDCYHEAAVRFGGTVKDEAKEATI